MKLAAPDGDTNPDYCDVNFEFDTSSELWTADPEIPNAFSINAQTGQVIHLDYDMEIYPYTGAFFQKKITKI